MFGRFAIVLALLSAGSIWLAPAAAAFGQSGTSEELRLAPALQKTVSVSIIARPLPALLRHLEKETGVSLQMARAVPAQRVTVIVREQPLWKVMDRIAGLLSHSPLAPKGYRWDREERTPQEQPRYTLRRDAWSIAQEAEEMDAPRRTASIWLRELWSLSRKPYSERESYRGPLPKSYLDGEDSEPFRTALASLSPASLSKLQSGAAVPLSPKLFPAEVEAYNSGWRDAAAEFRRNALTVGYPDPYPNGVPRAPATPPSIQLVRDDYEEEHPERATMFGLYLRGVQIVPGGDRHLVFNPLVGDDENPLTPLPGEPVVDLNAADDLSDADRVDISDMASVLETLVRKTGINLYEEHFYKPVYWGGRSRGIRTTRGRLAEIVNDVCREWKYTAVRAGSDYFLWSKTWAFDRSVDISDEDAAKWSERARGANGLTLEDRLELAMQFSFPQLRLTMDLLVPEAGPWNRLRTYRILRFLSGLTAVDRARIQSEGGLPLDSLHPEQADALIRRIVKPPSTLPVAAFLGSSVRATVNENQLRLEILNAQRKPFWKATEVFPRTRTSRSLP